jgi:hypothetical protein
VRQHDPEPWIPTSQYLEGTVISIMAENDQTRNGGGSHAGNATTSGMWDNQNKPKGGKK